MRWFVRSFNTLTILFTMILIGCSTKVPIPYSPCTMSPTLQQKLLKELHHQGVGVIEIGDTLTLILPTDSVFQTPPTQVKDHYQQTMKLIAKLVKSYPDAPVTISGHTDHVYMRHQRALYSLYKAKAVAAYLWAHGESIQHVVIKAQGDTHNVASNSTPDGAAFNRRVEIYIGVSNQH